VKLIARKLALCDFVLGVGERGGADAVLLSTELIKGDGAFEVGA
jgi:hypothetical protein